MIKWLRKVDLEEMVLIGHDEGWLIDLFELERIQARFPHLCYGLYHENHLIGAITGYIHQKSAWIGNFIVRPENRHKGYGRRLFETLLKALETEKKSLYLNAAEPMVPFYRSFGFETVMDIARVENGGRVPPFNFTSTQGKELERVGAEAIILKTDQAIFKENRAVFLTEDMPHKSSLRLVTDNGFLHSRVIGSRNVFIGPWETINGAYMDAEKMLRGVLYYRGLKNIVADVPAASKEIMELYRMYNFETVSTTYQMCKGEPIPFRYDSIYAFGSTGVCG